MNTIALVVIDIQNDITKHYRDIVGNINKAIDWAVSEGMHVVYIKHNNITYLAAAKAAREAGIGLNAGHDLNLDNLRYYLHTIPWTEEVSIGHALISDALYLGLEETIRRYLHETKG